MIKIPNLDQARFFFRDTLPATKLTNFLANRDVLVLDNGQSFIYTTIWEEVENPLKGKDGVISEAVLPPNLGFVSNWNELKAAWQLVINGTLRSISVFNNITILEPLVVPANYNKMLIIHGNGYDFNVDSSIPCVFKREYSSLQDANSGIDCQLRIYNVEFISKGAPRLNNAIDVQATYGAEIKGCRFRNFATAIKCGWNMGTLIDHNYFWENNIGIDLDYARFTGGSNSASQCNHTVVSENKFRNSAGMFANIKATAVSGLKITHNIFEGVQAGGDYDIYFDDNNSNVVKEVYIYGNHCEHTPKIASNFVKLKEGIATVGLVYSQYDCTLVKFESSAYAKMKVENIPYLTPGTKFENVRGEGRWIFTDLPSSFTPTSTDRWVGTMPTNSKFEYNDANGQQPVIYLGTRKL